MASEAAIIGKVFQPAREWAGAMMNFLGWDDPEKVKSMTDDMKSMIGTINGFVGGNIMSTDVVRALTNLGVLANAENGALPGNLNLKEFETLRDSYATLFNSKEGFEMIVDLYQRDAEIDQLRYEAWTNYSLGGVLKGKLFGDEEFDGTTLSDGEAVLKIRDKINALRDDMITGNEDYGWSDLSEQFESVRSKGKLVSDWNQATANGQGTISVTANVQGVNTTFELNMKDAEAKKDGQSVQFLGYSDESGNFEYGGQTYKIQVGPNKPVYEINTGKLDNNDQPIFVIKGFIMGAE